LKASVRLTGRLCQDQCKQGPNLTIGGDSHHGITADKLRELLEQLGSPLGRDHGTI
jgi:NADH:ubiquinone oxidoreductase subunit E